MTGYLKALGFLFFGRHLVSTVIIPGVLILLMMVLVLLVPALVGLYLGASLTHPVNAVLAVVLLVSLTPLVGVGILVLFLMLLGYQWRLIDAVQQKELRSLPGWTRQEWYQTFCVGLQGGIYCLLWVFLIAMGCWVLSGLGDIQAQVAFMENRVVGDFETITYTYSEDLCQAFWESLFRWVILFGTSLIFGAPFLLAPLFYNAHDPSLSQVFKNLIPAWRWADKRYGVVCLSIALGGGIALFLLVLEMLVSGSQNVVGFMAFPFVLMVCWLAVLALTTESFSFPPEREV